MMSKYDWQPLINYRWGLWLYLAAGVVGLAVGTASFVLVCALTVARANHGATAAGIETKTASDIAPEQVVQARETTRKYKAEADEAEEKAKTQHAVADAAASRAELARRALAEGSRARENPKAREPVVPVLLVPKRVEGAPRRIERSPQKEKPPVPPPPLKPAEPAAPEVAEGRPAVALATTRALYADGRTSAVDGRLRLEGGQVVKVTRISGERCLIHWAGNTAWIDKEELKPTED